jgi:hypothetical protein
MEFEYYQYDRLVIQALFLYNKQNNIGGIEIEIKECCATVIRILTRCPELTIALAVGIIFIFF